jgi:serine/threonine protein kinase
MPSAETTAPRIPNHEMLRVIGRGAYGEIWIARSLTGALRAVKVVYRSTFDSERSFNREFEGMARFEPISRAHEGFIDILDVGRDEAGAFFYYVMELGDDIASGDLATYAPRTLAAELSQRGRLPAAECVELGLSLTSALAALHRHGFAHRDIKPANVIFVGGVPKIADIGLVAASGQRSFVGTEGYVPPEGPGTAQADLYSLGKVLYELSMGKDRLDFPEVSTGLDQLPDKRHLMNLNAVLLKACAADPSVRYRSAEAMHEDLARLRSGLKPRRTRSPQRLLGFTALILAGACAALYPRFASNEKTNTRSLLLVQSEPTGAMVLLGDRLKKTPATFEEIEPGRYPLKLMLTGFEPIETRLEIEAGNRVEPPIFKLQRSRGSLEIKSDPTDVELEIRAADGEVRRLNGPGALKNLVVGKCEIVARHRGREQRETVEIRRDVPAETAFDFGSGAVTITSTPPGLEASADGVPLGPTPVRAELPFGWHELAVTRPGWPEQRHQVIVQKGAPAEAAFAFNNGSVKITSAPGGASVWSEGREIGRTPVLVEEAPPGPVQYELRLSRFKTASVSGVVKPDEQLFLAARFERRRGPVRGEPWENSLGMKFVPLGRVLMCVWETRASDYAAFCQATGRAVDNSQEPSHPIVRVSWNDAVAFCKWLTEKETAASLLQDGQSYRLPFDLEWSQAAGLNDEGGSTPEERDGKVRGEFPWGRQWPPPAGAGNFADQNARRGLSRVIESYQDGFSQTAPVGSFPPNRAGLYDVAGNVWEWIMEGYKGGEKGWAVLRGGSWANASRLELQSAYRNVVDRNDRDVIYGFRCVIEPGE